MIDVPPHPLTEMREYLVFHIATSIWQDDLDSENDEKTNVEGGHVEKGEPESLNVDEMSVYRRNTAVYDPNKDEDNVNDALFGKS